MPKTRALEQLLLDLRDLKKTPEVLKESFAALDEPVRTVLCRWVWVADKEPQGDPQYGEHRIVGDPRYLLSFADDAGNNIIERLVEYVHGLSSEAPLDAIITMCNQHTFRKIEAVLFDGSFKQLFYEAIAKRYIGIDMLDLLHEMQSIDDPYLRFVIAKFCMQEEGEIIFYIQKLRIAEEEYRFELAKIAAECGGGRKTASSIQKFGLTNPDHLFEIARLCAQMDGEGIALHVKKFGIQEKDRLFEIAKLCARQSGGRVALHIRNFGILEEERLFEIAKLCAQIDGRGTALYIGDFGLLEEDHLFEIAKLCAQQNGGGTALHIENFGILDEDRLFEIAKLCVLKDPEAAIDYIRPFCIAAPGCLFEIAKFCAQQNGGGTAKNIWNFGINDDGLRFEIAKLCAERDGGGTALYIRNFWINDEDLRFAIAKLCAQQNGKGTALSLGSFDITGEGRFFEVLKLCAEQDGQAIAKLIQGLGITDPNSLFEIAKRCAKSNGGETALYIQNFGINDEGRLFEIAKLCAESDGVGTAKNIRGFAFGDRDCLFKVAKICVLKAGRNVSYENFFFLTNGECKELKHLSAWSMIVSQGFSDEEKELFSVEIFPLVRTALCEEKHRFLIEAFSKEEKEMIESADSSKLTPQTITKLCGIQYLLNEIKEKPIPEIMRNTCVEALKYRNPQISQSYLWEICAYIQEDRDLGIYMSCLAGKKGPVEHLRLCMVMIAKWRVESDRSKELQKECENIRACVLQSRRFFKNGKISLMQTWLITCLALEYQTRLSAENKIRLLALVTSGLDREHPAEDLHHRLFYLHCLVCMKQEEVLAKATLSSIENTTQYLSSLITSVLRKNPYLDFGHIESFADKYLSTLGSMRVPLAWSTYAAQIRETGDANLQKAFQHAIVNVLEGTHRETRYAEDSSPHITKIVEKHRDVWNRWKAPHRGTRVSLELFEEKIPFSFQSYLRTKCNDGHLCRIGGSALDFLTAVIQDPSTAEEKQLECQEMAAKSEDPCLSSQDLLIRLYRENPSIEGILEKKEEIENAIGALIGYEIANDLRGLLEELTRNRQVQELLLIDTDDWQDLLLSGTEVSGSCQRVDGTPHLNKCLLAYMIDGKNRMLAMKEERSGKIQARALFRILWDPEKEEPVLFLDRIYPSPCPPAYKKALEGLAKQRARSLGLRLYVQGMEVFESISILSLGSRAPWEYADAAGGVQPNGIFCIRNAQEIEILL